MWKRARLEVDKILVVVHQETSTPGLIGQLLIAQGYSLDIRCPAMGASLPKHLAPYQGVIVFGGPMSANDENLPCIRQELDWIPKVLDSGLPYLGICLGGQLLARVLGATVAPHPESLREIGYVPIRPTVDGLPYFHHPLTVYQWHSEGFEIPATAVRLAVGDTFENQAFRYCDRTIGLQFHPEITRDMIHYWTAQGQDQLTLPGAQAAEAHLQGHERYGSRVEQWLIGFLAQWLDPIDAVDRLGLSA